MNSFLKNNNIECAMKKVGDFYPADITNSVTRSGSFYPAPREAILKLFFSRPLNSL